MEERSKNILITTVSKTICAKTGVYLAVIIETKLMIFSLALKIVKTNTVLRTVKKQLFSFSFLFSLLQLAKYLKPLFFLGKLFLIYIKMHKFALVKKKGGMFSGKVLHDNKKIYHILNQSQCNLEEKDHHHIRQRTIEDTVCN